MTVVEQRDNADHSMFMIENTMSTVSIGSWLTQVANITDKAAVQNVKNVTLCGDFHINSGCSVWNLM